jgi:hypothetical protein
LHTYVNLTMQHINFYEYIRVNVQPFKSTSIVMSQECGI